MEAKLELIVVFVFLALPMLVVALALFGAGVAIRLIDLPMRMIRHVKSYAV